MISLIAAIGKNRELGKNNKLLWHLPEDLKRFKDLTNGHPIIMGRKTFESIGRVLPNRANIVITRNTRAFLEKAKSDGMNIRGLIACDSLEAALGIAKDKKALEAGMDGVSIDTSKIFIIGGGQIFEQAMGIADRLYLTVVDKEYDADTFFPEYEEFKNVVSKKESSHEGIRYAFIDLTK